MYIYTERLYSCANVTASKVGANPCAKAKEEKSLFNRREVNMLHDPCSGVIREEEQFVEIQSLNTGHCWNIFKN